MALARAIEGADTEWTGYFREVYRQMALPRQLLQIPGGVSPIAAHSTVCGVL